MTFKKYSSIENSYQAKYVSKFANYCPKIQDAQYVAREKLDGANIQLLFTPNKPMKVGKRTAFLEEGDKFFDIWSVLPKYKEELETLQKCTDQWNKQLRVYGELVGPGINRRVNYGNEKTIWIFDVYVDGILMTQHELGQFLNRKMLGDMLVPTVGYFNSLKDALDVSVDFDSRVLDIKDNVTEGVIIQPLCEVIRSPNGERFILKKKGEKFKEVERKKHPDQTKLQDPLVTKLNLEFRSYVNKNRVLSVFSKHGEISEPKQIGEYLRYVLDDAKQDFLKENTVVGLEDKQIKQVFNVGSMIVFMLKEYL